MVRPMMQACAVLVIAVAVCASTAGAQELAWHRMQLPAGMRVLIIHAPGAKKQTTFSFLPLHLANDDAGRAQWSHLLEHMLIRSTDPQGFEADGVMFNGETTDAYLRLETFAAPPKWHDALDRHVRWLHTRAFDLQTLEREKAMIASEETATARLGHNGKFAMAAWNQIATHQRDIARVHGDVQQANLADVQAYAESRIVLNDSALLATIGPIPVEEMSAEIQQRFKTATGEQQRQPQHDAPAVRPPSHAVNMVAGWDLPTRHVLIWWALPDDQPPTLAAATGALRMLLMRIGQQREVASSIRSITPHAVVRSSPGVFMVINLCVNEQADTAKVVEGVRDAAGELARSEQAQQAIAFAAAMAANELSLQPRFEVIAQQMPPHMRDSAEGAWLLSVLNVEFAWRAPAEVVRAALAAADDDAVAAVLASLAQPAGSLILQPVQDQPTPRP